MTMTELENEYCTTEGTDGTDSDSETQWYKLPIKINMDNTGNNWVISFDKKRQKTLLWMNKNETTSVKVMNRVARYIGLTLMVSYYINTTPEFYETTMSNQLMSLITPIIVGGLFGKYITYISTIYYIGHKLLVN
jgi:hypothetical protein